MNPELVSVDAVPAFVAIEKPVIGAENTRVIISAKGGGQVHIGRHCNTERIDGVAEAAGPTVSKIFARNWPLGVAVILYVFPGKRYAPVA